MNLLDLPNEILGKIVLLLDQSSRNSLAATCSRLRDIVFQVMDPLKVRLLQEPMRDFLKDFGSSLRSLDLSNCTAPAARLREVLINCPHLIELNVVNSYLTWPLLWFAVDKLRKLETLSFSVLSAASDATTHIDEMSEGLTFPSIRSLHMEAYPTFLALELIIGMLKRCKSLERTHFFLLGNEDVDVRILSHSDSIGSQLFPWLWNSLRTVVLSVQMSRCLHFHHRLLKIIFAQKYCPKIDAWINRAQECYIFDNGWLSGEPQSECSEGPDVELLNRVAHIQLSGTETLDDKLRSPWGLPQSISLEFSSSTEPPSSIFEAITPKLSDLVELDFSSSHVSLPKAIRLNFFLSSSSLMTLAVPVCFIRDSVDEGTAECSVYGNLTNFTEAFRRMKLKRFFLQGDDDTCTICSSSCLNSGSLPQLNDLECLEELSLRSVHIENSAYEKIAHSKAHTIRLAIIKHTPLDGFPRFLGSCKNVRRLKLKGRIPTNSHLLWDAIEECKTLKQLCVWTNWRNGRSISMSRFRGIIARLECFHLHSPRPKRNPRDRNIFFPAPNNTLGSTYSQWMDELEDHRPPQMLRGRCLCYSGNFIGRVEPNGWD